MKKMIISLIIIFTLFYYSFEFAFECERGHYICGTPGDVDTWQCVKYDIEKQCNKILKCARSSQKPLYISSGGEISVKCLN